MSPEQVILLGAMIVPILLVVFNGLHKIPEGHVGVYYRGGALLESITEPGYHTKFPMITSYEVVQVTVQTDKVRNIPCGTSGGVVIHFEFIEVVNRLKKEYVHETIKNYTIDYDKTWIFEKIHHEINQFCSKNSLQEVFIDKFDTLDENLVSALQHDADKWAPGIEIIAIRVTKPKIPKKLLENYEKIESSKTSFMIADQEQKVLQKKAETKRLEKKVEAESQAEISKIDLEKQIASKQAVQKMEEIEDQIQFQRKKSEADAYHYKVSKMIDAEQKQLTKEFLQKLAIESFANNTKLYFGESIPKFIVENVDAMWKGQTQT